MSPQKKRLRCFLSGAAAGLINGFFGGGGGMLLLPLLRDVCGAEEKRAFATCVAVIAPLCVLSALLYAFTGSLSLAGQWPCLVGGALGGILAGRTLERVPVKLLRRIFALLLLYGGLRICL